MGETATALIRSRSPTSASLSLYANLSFLFLFSNTLISLYWYFFPWLYLIQTLAFYLLAEFSRAILRVEADLKVNGSLNSNLLVWFWIYEFCFLVRIVNFICVSFELNLLTFLNFVRCWAWSILNDLISFTVLIVLSQMGDLWCTSNEISNVGELGNSNSNVSIYKLYQDIPTLESSLSGILDN